MLQEPCKTSMYGNCSNFPSYLGCTAGHVVLELQYSWFIHKYGVWISITTHLTPLCGFQERQCLRSLADEHCFVSDGQQKSIIYEASLPVVFLLRCRTKGSTKAFVIHKKNCVFWWHFHCSPPPCLNQMNVPVVLSGWVRRNTQPVAALEWHTFFRM